MSKDTIEYEGKILEIDFAAIEKLILEKGGALQGEYFFRRYVFDVVPAKKGTWVRLRTDGAHTTLTVKEIIDDSIAGTNEWEVEVNGFEDTLTILKKAGLSPKGYQENKRKEFRLGPAIICLDTWPKIPPYMEVEADNKVHVEDTIRELGLDPSVLIGENTDKIYARYGIDINALETLSFDGE
jgi:adenylate cyclase class 2